MERFLSKMSSRSLYSPKTFKFGRPLLVLQSDDWGRVGVRDREGWQSLRERGINLGANRYDFYSLETADDVGALRTMLNKHRDSTGRTACLVMNFVTANLDFQNMTSAATAVHLKPLSEGLPGAWNRPGLFEAVCAGIADGVFYPALHGLTHFCGPSVLKALQNETQSNLLCKFWAAETPYIYWRMPWVGYEYCTPENSFLERAEQSQAIKQAAHYFWQLFGSHPFSACAPGYRANHETHAAWASSGIRVAQHGPAVPGLPHLDEHEILHLYRILDFEPSHGPIDLDRCLQKAAVCFKHGAPLIISIHSINFHSTLKDFRSLSLKSLDTFLSALERCHPELLYVHDADLYEIATSGKYQTADGSIPVGSHASSAFGTGVGSVISG